MELVSPSFEYGKPIPKRYTCEGEDVSPSLLIGKVPNNCKSLVLIVDDPDAPMGVFDHWIVWNLHPKTTEIAEDASLPHMGENGFGVSEWRGPCPPKGHPHRYFFKLYALDTMLNLKDGSTKDELEKAMKGHILEQVDLMGTYQRS